jgi:hypothetical protein
MSALPADAKKTQNHENLGRSPRPVRVVDSCGGGEGEYGRQNRFGAYGASVPAVDGRAKSLYIREFAGFTRDGTLEFDRYQRKASKLLPD